MKSDQSKTKAELIQELQTLRKRISIPETIKRKMAERGLEESEDRYRELVEKAGIAILIDNIKGEFEYFNKQFVKLFGYTQKVIQKLSIRDLVHPDDLERVMTIHKDRIRGNKVISRYEFRGIKKDRSIIHLEVSAVTLKENNSIVGTRSYLWDITERKQAQEKLLNSEQKFKNIAESTLDVVYRLNLTGHIEYVSPNVKELSGYRPEDLIGKHLMKTTPAKEIPRALKALKIVLDGNSLRNFEIKQKDKNGRIIPAEINAVPLWKNGKIVGGQGIMRDITERKDAEKKFKHYANRISAINEASNTLASNLNLQIVLDQCTKIARQMFAATDVTVFFIEEDSQYLTPIHSLGSYRDDIMAIRLQFGEGLPGKVAESGIAQVVNRIDLTDIYKRIPGAPVEPDSIMCAPLKIRNKVIGVLRLSKLGGDTLLEEDLKFLENLADISAVAIQNARLYENVQKSEKSYRLLSEQLNETNDQKKLLLDIITHDLKNPLFAISGIAERMLDEHSDNEMTEAIKYSSDKLLRVMDSATVLAQVAIGEKIELKEYNLSEGLRSLTKEFSSQLDHSGMILEINLSGTILIQANPIISEVFINYVSNAIKYATDGKKIIIDCIENTEFLTINVKDYGTTIPEEHRRKIFNRTYQIDGIKSGRGLGLSIVKKIAEAHNAIVGVKPNKPTGNIFYIKMPV